MSPNPGEAGSPARVAADVSADILMEYGGLATIEDGTYVSRTAPRFRTGDERYRWLNQVQAVARGGPVHTGVAYDVYRLL